MPSRPTRALFVAAGLVVAACGSDDEPAATEPPVTVPPTENTSPVFIPITADETTTTAAPDPSAGETTTVTEPVATTVAPATESTAPAAGAVDVVLVEWQIGAPTTLAAGPVTLNVVNNGEFPHELVVIRGDSYESLPLAENGAVLEDELEPGAIVGRTSRFEPLTSEVLALDLAPGNYVFVCNISSGPSSHAALGQRLSVVVS